MGRAGGGGGQGGGSHSFGGVRGGGSHSFGGSRGGGSHSFGGSSGGNRGGSHGPGPSNGFGGGHGGGPGFGGPGGGFGRPNGPAGPGGPRPGGPGPRPPRPPKRPLFITPGFQKKVVIINNNGGATNTANTNTQNDRTADSAAAKEHTQPNTPTLEQKIHRAERLAAEARESKKGAAKILLVALILLVLGVFLGIKANSTTGFEPYEFSQTVNSGYATDELNGNSGTKYIREACEEFYKKTGIPLYFYIAKENTGSNEVTEASRLYDTLFQDETHTLLVYFDEEDVWGWCTGTAANAVMNENEVKELLAAIEVYWYDYSLSLDQVIAKGVARYQKELLGSSGGDTTMAAVIFFIAGGVVAVVGVYTYVGKEKEAKQYEEQAKTMRAEQILSKPLESFGNQEVENLKNKYK